MLQLDLQKCEVNITEIAEGTISLSFLVYAVQILPSVSLFFTHKRN